MDLKDSVVKTSRSGFSPIIKYQQKARLKSGGCKDECYHN